MSSIFLRFWLMLSLALSGVIGHVSTSLAQDGGYTVIICSPAGLEKVTVNKNGDIVEKAPIENGTGSFQIKCPLCSTQNIDFIPVGLRLSDLRLASECAHFFNRNSSLARQPVYQNHPARAPPAFFLS